MFLLFIINFVTYIKSRFVFVHDLIMIVVGRPVDVNNNTIVAKSLEFRVGKSTLFLIYLIEIVVF